MAFNLDEIEKKLLTPIAKLQLPTATMYLYSYGFDALEWLRTKKNHESIERIRLLLPRIASLLETKEKRQNHQPLPSKVVQKLSDSELEQIAEIFASKRFSNINSHEVLRIKEENITSYLDLLAERELGINSIQNKAEKTPLIKGLDHGLLMKAYEMDGNWMREEEKRIVKRNHKQEIINQSIIDQAKDMADLKRITEKNNEKAEKTSRSQIRITMIVSILSLIIGIIQICQNFESQNNSNTRDEYFGQGNIVEPKKKPKEP